jgi:hypothetical protein
MEAKQSAIDAIRLFKEFNEPKNIPSILAGEHELTFQFDTQSLLRYYKGIFTKSAHTIKIQKALNQLGAELLAVQL